MVLEEELEVPEQEREELKEQEQAGKEQPEEVQEVVLVALVLQKELEEALVVKQ